MVRVFVYGTLKKGFPNHERIFKGYEIKITEAWAYGELYDLGWYPALIQGNNKVYGELLEFDDPEIFMKIDMLEGYSGKESSFNFYERRKIQVFSDKEEFTTWAYFLNKSKIIDSGGKLIASGIW